MTQRPATGLTVVADANSLIGLTKGGIFDRLPELFAEVWVPPRVVTEVVAQGQGRAGSKELTAALGSWIMERTADPSLLPPLAASLSLADRELLALARGLAADYLLTDDRALRREASRHHIAGLRLAELVVLLKQHGIIAEVKAVLDQMVQAQHGIAPAVYEQALRAAHEWPGP
jgi:predicted nucleic acid-binding protein